MLDDFDVDYSDYFNMGINDEDLYYINEYKLRLFKDFFKCNYKGNYCIDFYIVDLNDIFIVI